jgi:integrase
MAYAGLRGMEVAGTGRQHLTGRRLYLPATKGGRGAFVTLPTVVADMVRAAEPWDVCTATVRRGVRQALREAGSTASPHALRHTFGTELLRTTGNLRIVQESMRHASITSTAIYTAIADDGSDALNRLAGVDQLGQEVDDYR